MAEMIDIKKLKINKYYWQPIGPNRMKKLRQTIIDDGIITPLLIEKNHTIVDGILRFQIAKELGHTAIPCVYLEKS